MDFVQLCGIDALSSLRCDCLEPHLNYIADGVAVSCPSRNLLLEGPQMPCLDEATLVLGSTFQARVFLGTCTKVGRQSVWAFAMTGAASTLDSQGPVCWESRGGLGYHACVEYLE
jgi:hypothetical protein